MKRGLTTFVWVAIVLAFSQGPATAATFFPTTVSTLRSSITTANSNNQDDTIDLQGFTFSLADSAGLSSALPAIGPDSGHRLTIVGNGGVLVRAGGSPSFRILYILAGANVTLQSMSIQNGNPGALHGGGIYVDGETAAVTLNLQNVTITGCSGDYGGAVYVDAFNDPSFPAHTATLSVNGCTFTSNVGTQYGGAIWNDSGAIIMNVVNSTFSSNSATARSAGALQFDGSNGTATGSIVGCTFTHNSCANYGGAVNVDGFAGNANLTIANCTFDQNKATKATSPQAGWGGAIALDGSSGNATVTVDSCTFSGNFSTLLGDAIYLSETTSGTTVLQIGNSILASTDADYNITTDNLSGGTTTVTSNGYNLSDDAACGAPSGICNDATTGPGGLLNHSGDKRNTNPVLDPSGLKDNGGPTPTIALHATSPALDQGLSTVFGPKAIDQRGEFRPFDDTGANAAGGNASDIGAYEATVRLTSENRSGTTLNLTFLSILGHTYEVQSRPTLGPGTWTTVNTSVPAPPISGTGGIISVSVPNAIGSGTGFYRIAQQP